ncbi:hypothetical protein PF003_g1516 [Phytophthora fragariae]|nr:hypothetical protein PF003_g1516 [Phytophthora fragariae]
MTKPTTLSTAPPTAEELRERLNDESKTVDDDTALRAQVELWARLRAAFAANSLSSGIDALDDLAMTAIADDSATKLSLASTAVLLPSTDLPSSQEQPAHALFAPAPATARSKRTNSRGKGKVGAAPAKKRHTVIKSRRSWFQLPSNAPKKIKEDLARLEDVAAEQDTSPERLAYDGAPVILPPTPPVTKSTRDVPKQQDHTGLTDSSDDKEEDEEFPPPGRHGGEEDAPSDAFADDKLNENGPSDGSDDGPDPPKGSSDKKAGSKGDDRSTSKTSSSDKSDDAPSPDDKASKDSK